MSQALNVTAPVMPSVLIEWVRIWAKDVPAKAREGYVLSEDQEELEDQIVMMQRKVAYV